jgi:NADPH:quinone reductase-like Zn-dependent oxidoreductase
VRALVVDRSVDGGIALHEVPEPLVGPDEVVVEVRAISLNRGELRMLASAPDGLRPGWDFAGILRTDVDGGPNAGERVVGIRRGQAWAERVSAPRNWVAALPDGITFTQAAALPTAGLTALRTLRFGPAILGPPSARHRRLGRRRSFRHTTRTPRWC